MTQVDPGAGMGLERFVGRQAILDAREQTVAYELLFRSGAADNFADDDGSFATSHVVDQAVNVSGLDLLCSGRPAFINFNREALLQGKYTVLPPSRVVLELLEDVTPDAQVLRAAQRLRREGYRLALDDVIDLEAVEPLLPMADIVKIDCAVVDDAGQTRMVEELNRRGIRSLAEKVETRQEFDRCQRIGFRWFQGYFFQKPEIIARVDVPSSVTAYLQFLSELSRPEVDFAALEHILKLDVSLSVKLLRFLNSGRFNLPEEVSSIRQALVLLGENPLRRWASVVGVGSLAAGRPPQVVIDSLVRAHCCELIARHMSTPQQSEVFLMGLLSMLDVLTQQPMDEILRQMPISHEVRAALLGANNRLGQIFSVVRACERQDQWALEEFAKQLNLLPGIAQAMFVESLAWADEIHGSLPR